MDIMQLCDVVRQTGHVARQFSAVLYRSHAFAHTAPSGATCL